MAVEFATSIATTIFDQSIGAIFRHVGYLWNYKKNMADLETHVNKLDNVRNDKSHAVVVAQRNAERIRSQVESWQNEADNISLEARNIMELYEENAKKRCLIGLCPNVVSRYQLSRKACKKQMEIVEAVTEANQFNVVADRSVRRAMSIVSIEGYLTFDSRKSTLDEIIKTLKEATKNSIGVYGLGGMGKTTLIKQVASRAAEEKLFDEIVMASVTQTPELIEIQGQIAKKLDLKLEESSVAERAGRIHERLKERKVLVILDDLWGKLDLEKVGIPFGVEHVGCKILFTSRFQSVLSSMGSEKDFHLGALKEDEVWRLFEEKTADVVQDPAFLEIGKKVAKRCAGLPVMIVTVAASLSSRPSLPVWKDALKELQKMNNKEVHEIVNSAVEYISYNHLEETHKRVFLLCGLYGSGFHMSDLLKYSWGWNFFDDDVVTLEEARNKLHALIVDLKASCLLLDGDNEDVIKIHDVVRSVAVSLARKNEKMLCFGEGVNELIRWADDDVLRSCAAMVFKRCRHLPCLPKRLECPSLEFFILDAFSLDTSPTIPNTFFEKTRELKVLDMTKLCFPVLPSSLSCLENLQTLCLDHCTNLEDISMIGDLKKLQVLSSIGSDIKELPREIGQLSELRLLDVRHCSKLEIIPAGLLASLSNLEELYMSKSFNRWEAEDCHSSNSERRNVSLAELKHLPKLHSLEIDVQDAKLLSRDLNFERLERYRIIAGDILAEKIDKKGISRTLGMNHLQNGVKGLLKRTECLCLQELKGIKNITQELDRDGFKELKHLIIQTDYDIQFIINVEIQQQRAFPALESLYLSNLLKLEKICNGQLIQDTFCKLTSVNVLKCNKLESLFSFSMATGLPCLQELQVSECSILKGIVAKKSREDANVNSTDDKIDIVQLRKLSLECLPQIITFYSCAKMLPILETNAQSKEIFLEEEEHTSSIPFFKEVSFPKLEELKLSEISNLIEIWVGKLPEKSYCNLKSLVVQKCSRLVSLFSSNLLELSRKLEVLNVNCCDLLEEVFVAPDGLDIDEEHNGLVPQLIQLCLVDLPKLGCIWRNYQPGILSFKNLKYLSVEKCSSLKYLFTPSITIGLVRLKTLTIKSCVMMKEIVVKEEGSKTTDAIIFPQLSSLYLEDLPNLTTFYSEDEVFGSNENSHNSTQPLFNAKVNFPSLFYLRVDDCSSLKYMFTPSVTSGLMRLQGLSVKNCGMMEEIVVKENEEATRDAIIFPHLTLLLLEEMPKLTTFYSGDKEMGSNENIHDDIQLLFNEKVSFPSLEKLIVDKCGSLKYLFTPSVIPGFVRLQTLNVENCVMMEEIVAKEDGEATRDAIIFPQLTHLRLAELPKLTTFYSGIEEMGSDGNIHNDIQLLFNEKAKFPSLESLTIYNLDNIRSIWHNQFNEEDSFCKLEVVDVRNCAKLLKIFPSTMLNKIQSVKKIWIADCDSLDEVFEIQTGLNLKEITNVVTKTSQLRDLQLINLPKLRYIWKKDFSRVLRFENIWNVCVCKCESMIHVFSDVVAQNLHQLEKLYIDNCEGVETIVDIDDEDENKEVGEEEVSSTTFTFPRLTKVHLYKLPKVECFYPKKHTMEWAALEELNVKDCNRLSFPDLVINDGQNQLEKLRKLSLECPQQIISFYSEEIFPEGGELSSFKPFLKEVSFPKLEELKLSGITNLTEIWEGKLPEKSCCNLKSFVVQNCSRLVSVFSSNLLELSRKLEVLNVSCCDLLEEVFVAPDGLDIDEERNGLVPQLTQLCLVDLPKLGCIWRNYQPGILSFKNLQDLRVEKCSSLKYLFTPSVTIGLVRLKTLIIKSCVMMKEIVIKEDGETTDAIIFPQLSSLYLDDLPNLTTFYSEGEEIHKNIQLLFNEKANFPSLESLTIYNLDNIRSIWHNQPNEGDSFCKLEDVDIRKCAKLLKIFPSTMLNKIQSVKQIWIVDCDSLDEVFEIQTGLNSKEITNVVTKTSQLRDLQLINLPKLRYIWKKDFSRVLRFENLWNVCVCKCESMIHVFSDVVAQNLHQLEKLYIENCEGVETIVDIDDEDENKEVGEEEVSSTTFTFPRLTKVHLYKLPKVECFYPKKHTMEWAALEELNVKDCNRLSFPDLVINDGQNQLEKLRKLSLECPQQIISFYSEEIFPEGGELSSFKPFLKEVSFPKLEELKLSGITNLTEIWEGKLPEKSCCNLKSFVVQNCSRLVSVFSSNLLELSRKLEVLNVSCCDLLEEVFVAPDGLDIDEERNGLVPQLTQLCLVDLPKLGCIWRKYQPGILSFKNLQDLRVEKCSSLKYLFTPSVTIGLVRLKTLTIKSCVMMKEIVVKEEGSETTDAIFFPQLSGLYLENLPNLTTFYSEGEEIHKNIQLLFNEKAKFPSLESLAIDSLDNITNIWHNQFNEEDSFCKLEDVDVRKCAKLLKIFPSTMLNKIQSVKKIWIVDCDSLDEVFEVQIGLNWKEINVVTSVSRLRDLYLDNLPKLRSVWEKNFHKILRFENLWEVDVRECESLKHVFSDFVAQNLRQLEKLHIEDCKGVETIVDVDDEDENKDVVEEEVCTNFLFPKLTQVRLLGLQKVECFYRKKHTMEWPALEEIYVNDCNKLSLGELVMNDGQKQLEKLLCRLKGFTIGGKDMKKMAGQFGHFPQEFLLNLRELALTNFDGDESAAFPSNFLCRLPHLEELLVGNSSIQEIFVYEGEGPPLSLPHLKTLILSKLSELKYIWKEDAQCLIPILDKLDILDISECPHLTNLLPHHCTLSFKFLTQLEVVNCVGFIKLIQSSSTAASLEQLKSMRISGCEMIEEIVAADDGDHDHDSQVDHDIIIFSKLQKLELEDLPKLTSFCTANYTFKFPELTTVKVIQCPNMKTFSTGITITPMLQKVYIDDSDAESWNGNLNTTVQQLFSETEIQRLTAAADPSTSSSNNHSQPEAKIHDKPTESAANEIEEISEESTNEPREEIWTCGDASKPGKGKGKEKIEMSEEDPNCQDQASSTMPLCVESSVCTEQPSEKSEETVPSSLSPANEPEEQNNPVSLAPRDVVTSLLLSPARNHPETSPSLVTEAGTSRAGSNSQQNNFHIANEPEEQTNAGSLAPRDVVTSLLLSPSSNRLGTSPSLVTEAGTSRAGSNSQQNDFQISRVTQEFITLLSEIHHIRQTQPLDSMSEEQVHFMLDAFHSLSSMNFSDLFSPYVEKVRERLSSIERKKEIFEIDLRIAELKAQMQALEEKKKVLEEKN